MARKQSYGISISHFTWFYHSFFSTIHTFSASASYTLPLFSFFRFFLCSFFRFFPSPFSVVLFSLRALLNSQLAPTPHSMRAYGKCKLICFYRRINLRQSSSISYASANFRPNPITPPSINCFHKFARQSVMRALMGRCRAEYCRVFFLLDFIVIVGTIFSVRFEYKS